VPAHAVSSGLTAVCLVCTLKPSPAESSAQLLGGQLMDALAEEGVDGPTFRVVDFDIKPGVDADMGDGDEWPAIREQILAADILVIATPTWMGHMTSEAQRVLERLDADLSEMDERGRPNMFDKVAVAAIVGNEDGAHQITAELFQALNDIGFTLPAQGVTYWNGEAM
jgi:multimeric flavodoxin WrbA